MNVDAPPERNLAQEGRDSLQAQIDLAPQTYAAKSQFDPLYTDLQVQQINRALLGNGQSPGLLATLKQIQPELQSMSDASQSQQRAADIKALQDLGPAAVQALRSADPLQQALVQRLNSEATTGLDAGAGVDPSLANVIGQRLRGRSAANGFGFGLPDAVTEAYAVGDRGQALRQQRQQFALQTAGVNAATGADPALAILGRPSTSGSGAQSLLGAGQANAAAKAPDFNPFNSYASDLFNTNYNGQAAANIAGTNATAGIIGGGLGAAGNALGGMSSP